jgi:hypothetical protein
LPSASERKFLLFFKGDGMKAIVEFLKALRAYGLDAILLGLLEKLLKDLIAKLTALLSAASAKKAERIEQRANKQNRKNGGKKED